VTRVLVLGGTGFVGPYIVRQLLDRGHDVTLFHRGRDDPALTVGARHVHADFARLPEHVAGLMRLEPEVVVDVSPGLGKGGHGVLHFAGIANRGVVLTSLDVYRAMFVLWGVEPSARPQPMPVSEESELRDGRSPDLTADLEFDNLDVERAVAACPELPVTVLRCPIIYGPGDPQRRLQTYVRRMADGRPAIVLDARLARLRLSRGYVENVAQAAVAAVSNDRAAGRTYNVAEPDALSEAEWVRAIAAELAWNGKVVIAPSDAALPPQDLIADTSRIREELGYAEGISRREGLRRAIEWERSEQRSEAAPDYTTEDAALRPTSSE